MNDLYNPSKPGLRRTPRPDYHVEPQNRSNDITTQRPPTTTPSPRGHA